MAKTYRFGDQENGAGAARDAAETLNPADVLPGVGIAVYDWDIASDALRWSAGAADLLRTRPARLSTGCAFSERVDPDGPPGRHEAVVCSGERDDGAGVSYQMEYRFRTDDKVVPLLWIEDIGHWHAGPDGRPARACGVVRTINERRARDERLVYRSDHDDLTGGLNRPRLLEDLEAAIESAQRNRASAGFAIVAIDNLAVLNDAYGYDVADEIIAGVARRIRRQMRTGDVLGRLSGNKIGVVLHACDDADIRVAAERFSRTVASVPVQAGSASVTVTVSVGGAVVPRDGGASAHALGHAQEALDEARQCGCGGIVVYEPSPGRDAARAQNVRIAAQIVAALNEGRLTLALQPVVAAGDHAVVFHEALCRINLENGGRIAAADFIETAERLGIVRLVDHRTLDLAIAGLEVDPALVLSLNVSAIGACDGSWFARLNAQLRDRPQLAERLIIEITETMTIRDMARAIAFVRSVRDLGCRVAIDDFGAGHTSFRSLRSLGADIVKIDGAFVERLSQNEDDRFFVATLVALAGRIGLKTVAERVSRPADAHILRELGVDYLQGRLFGLETDGAPDAGNGSAEPLPGAVSSAAKAP